MILKVSKSVLKGEVDIPASKSHTIRAIAIAALADGQSTIENPLISSDAISAVECYRKMGAKIDTTSNDKWIVTGTNGIISTPQDPIDVGNSGTTLRLAMGSAALASNDTTLKITGDEQIQGRPVGELINALNGLGANACSIKGNEKAPVEISGKLAGGKIDLKCVTSQFLSSLLLACPLADGDTEINVTLLNEPDYVRITLDWLNWQGIKYETSEDLMHIKIPGRQKYKAFKKRIPADFSSATFFLCAGAFIEGSDILIKGLDFSDSQPDKAVVDYLRKMGAEITAQADGIRVRASKLHGTEINMNKTPDALPAMAVTAAFASGQTKFVNVAQARVKETDRIACMAKELGKMGLDIEEFPDGVAINCGAAKCGDFNGYGDHRIVMAMSLAAMACDGQSTINTAEAMNVTFPNFLEYTKKLGANMELVK